MQVSNVSHWDQTSNQLADAHKQKPRTSGNWSDVLGKNGPESLQYEKLFQITAAKLQAIESLGVQGENTSTEYREAERATIWNVPKEK